MSTGVPTTAIENPFWDEAGPLLIRPPESASDRWSPAHIDHEIEVFRKRDGFVHRYCWAIPDPASLDFVAQWLGANAIEIGAGTGYWAWQMAQRGVDIIAFDECPMGSIERGSNIYFHASAKTWHPVQLGGPEILAEHTDRSLFLCWPPCDESMAAQCLRSYQGGRLVYIGDRGCTGDEAFFKILEEGWEAVATHRIVQWFGMNDWITVYQRKVMEEA